MDGMVSQTVLNLAETLEEELQQKQRTKKWQIALSRFF